MTLRLGDHEVSTNKQKCHSVHSTAIECCAVCSVQSVCSGKPCMPPQRPQHTGTPMEVSRVDLVCCSQCFFFCLFFVIFLHSSQPHGSNNQCGCGHSLKPHPVVQMFPCTCQLSPTAAVHQMLACHSDSHRTGSQDPPNGHWHSAPESA